MTNLLILGGIRKAAQGLEAVITALNNSRASDADWTLAGPVALIVKPGGAPGAGRRGRHRQAGNADQLRRRAYFLLDTVEQDTLTRKAPLVRKLSSVQATGRCP